MFTSDFFHGECNGHGMYDYELDYYEGSEVNGYGPSSPLTTNLIGKIKAESGRAVLFELLGEFRGEYKIVGEKWLPTSQIKMSPIQTRYSPDPLPKELEGFVRINTPLWLVNKFKGQFQGTIQF